MTEDSGAAAPEVFAERTQPCGCRGVSDGQHVPPCEHCTTPEAPHCSVCGMRTATDPDGACGRCGRPK